MNKVIPATLSHDRGAYARCSYCGRYSDNPRAIGSNLAQSPVCDCGRNDGWSGSFVSPDINSTWAMTDQSTPQTGMVGTVPNTEEEARNEFKRITGIMAVGVAGTYRPQVVKLAQSAQRGERLWLAVRAAIEQYAPDLEAVKEAIEIYEYERTANE